MQSSKNVLLHTIVEIRKNAYVIYVVMGENLNNITHKTKSFPINRYRNFVIIIFFMYSCRKTGTNTNLSLQNIIFA